MNDVKKNGQAETRPIRLSEAQWESIRVRIESYISRGWDEARVYWPDGQIGVAPVRMGKKEPIG